MANDYYLLIAGSRGFGNRTGNLLGGETWLTDDDIVRMIADELLKSVVQQGLTIHIVQGEARGADAAGKRYSRYRGYDCIGFHAEWDKHGKRAGMVRNAEMYGFLKGMEHRSALLFWDGTSRGTRNNFICAANTGVRVVCYQYELNRFLTDKEMADICDAIRNERRY